MKSKLLKFTEFANSLYPHETDYLLSVQTFEKSENLKILNLINYNSKNPQIIIPYDVTIDKRKYNYVKNWINKNLTSIDVDEFYNWLISKEKLVMTDAVSPVEEKDILSKANKIKASHYYFIRFYELMQKYRDYLLIRMRMQYYQPVSDYLEKHEKSYKISYEINENLNQATIDIIKQHNEINTETRKWEEVLTDTFYDITIDGYTRYRAVVRLTFLYYNYREFEKLREIYKQLDILLKTEVFYSKRILANYYANISMMHSKLNELDEAEKYGYLAIRQKNSDFLFYLLNLCGVLLRANKSEQAYCLMTDAIPELKNTASFYYKIGFVSFYIKTLSANSKNEKAADYAKSFLDVYKKEVFKHRWHIFFSAYMQALFKIEDYKRILSLTKKHNLVIREKQFIAEAKYMPIILWYNLVSEFMENEISEQSLIESIVESGKELIKHQYKSRKIKELIDEISPTLPQLFKTILLKLKI
ncbi:MAG: hypothetical protein JEZ09_01585 [Salinivirgaceae bacterium]|nr:hypothetical protein [Salinivirgaceae bacterium]